MSRPGAAAIAGSLAFALALAGCSPPSGSESAAGGDDGSAGEEAAAAPSRVAPEFELVSLEGETVRLAELRGKTVVIDFWATWCPPCEFQVPELNAFYEAHRADGAVSVLGISVDTEGGNIGPL